MDRRLGAGWKIAVPSVAGLVCRVPYFAVVGLAGLRLAFLRLGLLQAQDVRLVRRDEGLKVALADHRRIAVHVHV